MPLNGTDRIVLVGGGRNEVRLTDVGKEMQDATLKQTKLDRAFTYETFQTSPVTAKAAGGAASGTAGHVNVMALANNVFEYSPKGTQTITAPVINAGGLNISMDLTDNDGVEITQGITTRCPTAFKVGTSPAFYFKARLKIADVSGTDDCAVGFRKAEAYQANIDDYNDMACLNVISGDITTETILNDAATVTTDTTDDWADAAEKTLEVYVSATGVVSYKIDGAAPTAVAATPFAFAEDEIVVPFLFFLHASDVAENTLLVSWECGLQ